MPSTVENFRLPLNYLKENPLKSKRFYNCSRVIEPFRFYWIFLNTGRIFENLGSHPDKTFKLDLCCVVLAVKRLNRLSGSTYRRREEKITSKVPSRILKILDDFSEKVIRDCYL